MVEIIVDEDPKDPNMVKFGEMDLWYDPRHWKPVPMGTGSELAVFYYEAELEPISTEAKNWMY